ncbi:MAG: GTPase HflX [Candidatus Geothermincolales bacterium]
MRSVRNGARDGENPTVRERAVLVGVHWGRLSQNEMEDSLEELRSLAETAGAEVVGIVSQRRERPDPATLVGSGKLEEIAALIEEREADLVIFDQDLSPSQQRNLENRLGIKVLDRTALILDIFAIHAHSKEGKAQVEMAQLQYSLTRLTGRGAELSRLGGGIGTRGPGETKLEVDRRRIHQRIKTLRKELKELSQVRRIKRKRRQRFSVPVFALVGYTNAGKSSLLNAISRAGVLVEDKLFSTLDPVTRRVTLPDGRTVLLTDTVGFISHLPHQLVEAFKSTLEEVKEADVLVHVMDASARDLERKVKVVEGILEEIGAGDLPVILVLNKTDLISEERKAELERTFPGAVFVSALTGQGLDDLRSAMLSRLILAGERT